MCIENTQRAACFVTYLALYSSREGTNFADEGLGLGHERLSAGLGVGLKVA